MCCVSEGLLDWARDGGLYCVEVPSSDLFSGMVISMVGTFPVVSRGTCLAKGGLSCYR